MAQIPTEREVIELQEDSLKADERKRLSQERQGKDFVNYGQGVIPESVWQNMPGKKLDDPEATE